MLLPVVLRTPAVQARCTLVCGLVAAAAALLAACSTPPAASPAPAAPQGGLQYPVTRQMPQSDTYHGMRVSDPYRWLEDDNSPETAAWVVEQNKVTDAYLAATPQREPTRRIYTELYNFEKFGLPYKEGNRYFWTRNDGLQQQSVMYTAASPNDTPQVALDPNLWSTDGTVALAGAVPSRDGKLIAYGVSNAGSDWQTWRVRDLATGGDRTDELQWVKFSGAAWTTDGKGFFYSRYDAPKDGAALTGVNQFHKLYYHRLGTKQSDDVLVAENKNDKEWGFGAQVSDDGRVLLINVFKGSAKKNGLMVLPLPRGAYAGGKPVPVSVAFDAEYDPVVVDGNRLIVKTDKGAPNGRLIVVNLKAPSRQPWPVLVPEGKDALDSAGAVGGKLYLRYLRDASTLVRVHAADGKALGEVALPGIGTAGGFGGRWTDRETFFNYTSITTPPAIYRLNVADGKTQVWKRPATAFDPDQYETRREFVTSKDGTRVPVFIAYRKGLKLDGRNPTLLYGYGGFNIAMTPTYAVTAATWMRMGGVYVLAALRGGGEYGTAWHDAGTKLKKQNTFDDFIAVAEWLIAQGYTKPDRLAINGGSNGGLLVGAVLNQRPELFGAAVPAVGVMDMLRFHKFTIGWAWTSDYGSSDNADEFVSLYAYSPLHNIASGKRYPPVLVMTADHDDRVVPAHSFKYIAALQAADTGPAPKLIRIETRAGHGAGKPTSKLIEERADMLAFMARQFDMQVNAGSAPSSTSAPAAASLR